MSHIASGIALRSTALSSGRIELSFSHFDMPEPGPGEIVVKVEAVPINPSDLSVLFASADLRTLSSTGQGASRVVSAELPPERLATLKGRLDRAFPAGNEGAGRVVAAGAGAEHLLGKRVAAFCGGMYAEYRLLPAADILVLPDDLPASAGASAFINPLTSLGMVETLRREGHRALVHTAAASNLGQMLVRVCQTENVPLVNIVRSADQAARLRSLGAIHVCDSSAPDFEQVLTDAIEATGATLAFDAVGGGTLAGTILHAMEIAINRSATEYNTYGSTQLKQVYIYGFLDPGPTVINRSFGMAWRTGGWLLRPFFASIDPDTVARLHWRVADELTSTFASSYNREISLTEMLEPDRIAEYARHATGTKTLVTI